MKKIMCMLAVLLAGLSFLFSACDSNDDQKVRNLFDSDILQSHNISWLQKPSGAFDEQEYIDGGFRYNANFTEFHYFSDYCTSVFQQFKNNDTQTYFPIGYDSHGELWNYESCCILSVADNLEECKYKWDEPQNEELYTIYYSPKNYGTYNAEHDGYTLSDVYRLVFCCTLNPDENGHYNFQLTLEYAFDHYYVRTTTSP